MRAHLLDPEHKPAPTTKKTPEVRPITFGEYAATWIECRAVKPRTRAHYEDLLRLHILPTFEKSIVVDVTPVDVRTWNAKVAKGRPTARAHAYSLLKTIFAQAVDDELRLINPCRIKGAGQTKRVVRIHPASIDELETLVIKMPDRFRAMVLLAAWCALRFGELVALRRQDIDVVEGVLRVDFGISRTRGQVHRADPKASSNRDVAIPPHLLPALVHHLAHVADRPDALLFPAADGVKYLACATLYNPYYRAREAAGRPDLRFHDLRHTGAVLAAATGATLAELMARLGHSTPAAAMRYQHAAKERDREIAQALSRNVIDLDARRRRKTA
jgi:integrase